VRENAAAVGVPGFSWLKPHSSHATELRRSLSLVFGCCKLSAKEAIAGFQLAFADGALFPQFGASSILARFHVMPAFPQLLDEPTALEEFLETAQGCTDRFPVMNAHPQRHAVSPGRSL
jgi:hypothetical protein